VEGGVAGQFVMCMFIANFFKNRKLKMFKKVKILRKGGMVS